MDFKEYELQKQKVKEKQKELQKKKKEIKQKMSQRYELETEIQTKEKINHIYRPIKQRKPPSNKIFYQQNHP